MRFWIAWFDHPAYGNDIWQAKNITIEDVDVLDLENMFIWADARAKARFIMKLPCRFVFSEYGNLRSYIARLGWFEPEMEPW